jgi:hypothetical protein
MSRKTSHRQTTYPALNAWRRELANGERGKHQHDPLWRAACCEVTAQDFADIPLIHDGCMRDAREIIVEAAREQRGAAA